jgi:hypothetical protein
MTERCPHCGANMKAFWHTLNPGLVSVLVKCIQFVHEHEKNEFHLQHDLHLSVNEFSNFTKLRLGRMQRNFDPMRKQIDGWKQYQLTDGTAKNIIYDAYLDDELALPRHLLRPIHEAYFNPQYQDFTPRTLWSLTNAFTTALKLLDPVPQFKATARLGQFFALFN